MKSLKLHGLLLAAAIAMPLAGQAQAQAQAQDMPAHMHGGPGMAHERFAPRPFEHGIPPFLHGIELSEAQQDKVFAILHAQAPLMRDQHKAVMKAHEALHALAVSGRFDDARASALAQSVGQAMARITLEQVRSEQQLRALLTAEQRAQIEQNEQHQQQGGPRHPPRPQ